MIYATYTAKVKLELTDFRFIEALSFAEFAVRRFDKFY